MAKNIKLELNQSKLRLEYFKARNETSPNPVDASWIEIYANRVEKLEHMQLKANAQRAAGVQNLKPRLERKF